MNKVFKSLVSMTILLGIYSCSAKKKEESVSDLTIKVNNVEYAITDQKEEFPFISKPFRTSELSFRVSGPLHQFDVIAGNYYKKGDVIAEIDPRDFKIRLEKAESKYLQAKSEFERIESLYNLSNISASTYEKAKADYSVSYTAYKTAKNELDDTKLIAPFDGYIGEVYMEKFQDVKATQPIISYIELNKLRIETYVPQHIVGLVNGSSIIEILFDAYPNDPKSAVILDISKNTTKNNLSYLMTSAFDNKDNKIFAGMSGKVVFNKNRNLDGNVPVIPQVALCHRPAIGDYVWIVDPVTQNVEMRIVKTGNLLPNGTIEINEGVNVGEKIAVSGLRFLSNEKKVNVIDESGSGSVLVNKISSKK